MTLSSWNFLRVVHKFTLAVIWQKTVVGLLEISFTYNLWNFHPAVPVRRMSQTVLNHAELKHRCKTLECATQFILCQICPVRDLCALSDCPANLSDKVYLSQLPKSLNAPNPNFRTVTIFESTNVGGHTISSRIFTLWQKNSVTIQ